MIFPSTGTCLVDNNNGRPLPSGRTRGLTRVRTSGLQDPFEYILDRLAVDLGELLTQETVYVRLHLLIHLEAVVKHPVKIVQVITVALVLVSRGGWGWSRRGGVVGVGRGVGGCHVIWGERKVDDREICGTHMWQGMYYM